MLGNDEYVVVAGGQTRRLRRLAMRRRWRGRAHACRLDLSVEEQLDWNSCTELARAGAGMTKIVAVALSL